MTAAPVTFNMVESVSRLAYVLLSTSHGAYPVVTERGSEGEPVFSGYINR